MCYNRNKYMLKGIKMNQKLKLKFGVPLLVLSIIIMVLSGLGALVLLFLRGFMVGLFPEDASLAGLDFVFVLAALIVLAIGSLILVGGINSRHSRGWSIFLVVMAGIVTLFSLIGLQIFTLLLFGAVTLLASLNIKDSYDQEKGNVVGQVNPNSLEASLSNLTSLYHRGLITQEEYDKSREETLSKF